MSGVPRNYSELREAIVGELARGDIGQEAAQWIGFEEIDLIRDIKLEEAELITTSTLIAGRQQQLPVGWKDMYSIKLLYAQPVTMTRVDFKALNNLQIQKTGAPASHFVIIGDQFIMDAEADGLGVEFYYRGTPTPLSETNPVNKILRDAPDVLFYGALVKSAAFIGDDARIATWLALYQPLRDNYAASEWMKKAGEQSVRQYPDVDPNDSHRPSFRSVGTYL